jgi:hypothetical protein
MGDKLAGVVVPPPSLAVAVRRRSVQHAAVCIAQHPERNGPRLVGYLE